MESETETPELPMKVVTTLGAMVLAEVSNEAVRVAVQNGRVEVAAGLYIGTRPAWLLELASVEAYWGVSPEKLRELREDIVLDLESVGERWQIMTPPELRAALFPRPWGSGPLWFRFGREDRADQRSRD